MATNNLVTELDDPSPDSIWPYVCDVCGLPIFTTTPDPRDDDENLHYYHEADCPNYQRYGDNVVECECSGMTHPECCPECAMVDKDADAPAWFFDLNERRGKYAVD